VGVVDGERADGDEYDQYDAPAGEHEHDHEHEPRVGNFFIAVRVVAVALLALLMPLAGVIALGGLVLLYLFRSRVELATMLVLYALVLFLVPSRYTVGPFAVTGAMAVAFLALLLWGFGRTLGTLDLERHTNGARIGIGILFFTTLAAYGIRMLNPVNSLDQSNADRNAAVMLALCAVAIAIMEGLRNRRQLDLVLGALVLGASAVAAIAFLQYFTDLDIASYIRLPGFKATSHEAFVYERDGIDRVAGTARHPIEFGLAMAAVLPIAMHFVAHARTALARFGGGVASLLIAGALPLALSRSAALSFALAALIVVPTWPARRRWRVAAVLAVLLVGLQLAAPQILPQLGGLLSTAEGTGSLETRGRATDVAFELINDKPIFGHGFSAAFESPVIIDNQFLITTIETGVIGLLALLTAIGLGFFSARRARLMSTDPSTRDLAQCVMALIAAIALGGFGLNIVRFPMTAGILFVGIGVAGALLRFEREAAGPVYEVEGAAHGTVAPEPVTVGGAT
jgi:O-antigen ligase